MFSQEPPRVDHRRLLVACRHVFPQARLDDGDVLAIPGDDGQYEVEAVGDFNGISQGVDVTVSCRLEGAPAAPIRDGTYSQVGDYGAPLQIGYEAIAEHVRDTIDRFRRTMPSFAVDVVAA